MRRTRAGTAMALGCLLLVSAAACDAGDPVTEVGATTPARPSVERATDTTPGPDTTASDLPASEAVTLDTNPADEGISVEEASELGVLTGTFDALLEGPTDAREVDGCAEADLTLTNVGQEPDRYTLQVTDGPAEVEPDVAELDPGAAVVVTLRTCDPDEDVVLDVVSAGRGGEIVAQYRSR